MRDRQGRGERTIYDGTATNQPHTNQRANCFCDFASIYRTSSYARADGAGSDQPPCTHTGSTATQAQRAG